MFAASETILNLPFAVSIGVGAALVGALGFRPMYLANAVVLSACGAFLLWTRVGQPQPPPERAIPEEGEALHTPEGVVPPA